MPHRVNRRAQALILVAFSIITLLGFFAMIVDVALAFYQKTRMQAACDFAALAAAVTLPTGSGFAQQAALKYANANGFGNGQGGTVVSFQEIAAGARVRVTITRPYQPLVAQVVGMRQFQIGAIATAEFIALAPMSIDGNDQMNNIQSLGLFGPYAKYGNGDPFSVKYMDNGQLNSSYQADGWNFNITVPASFSGNMKVAIFDPDCGNVGGAVDAGAGKLDEMRDPPSYPNGSPGKAAKPAGYNRATETVYKLYKPDNTPNDYTDDVLVATYSIRDPILSGPNQTDMKWVSPSGFTIDTSTLGKGTYRLNVQTVNGSSENGFLLRAGSPSMNFENPALTPTHQPLVIEAPGYLPLNLNTGGNITPTLGTLPPNPTVPMTVYINKFDTEGSGGITYKLPNGTTVNGTRAGSNSFAQDSFVIPAGGLGGPIKANYNGNALDTSMWSMWFTGVLTGTNQRARLVME